jgi:hypothetical protein
VAAINDLYRQELRFLIAMLAAGIGVAAPGIKSGTKPREMSKEPAP